MTRLSKTFRPDQRCQGRTGGVFVGLFMALFICETQHPAWAASTVAGSAGPTYTIPSFVNVTAEAGIYHAGMFWGSAWGDYNGDGWPDIWINNHLENNSLYLNNKDGTFSDIADSVLSIDPDADSHGAAWADFDNDGNQDLIELIGAHKGQGQGANYLLVSDQGMLVDKADIMGIDDPFGRGRTPLWLDYNRDGRLDVFIANLTRTDGLGPSALYRQEPTGFVPVNDAVGLNIQHHIEFAQLSDLTGDGKVDLIIQSPSVAFPYAIYNMRKTPFLNVTQSIGMPFYKYVKDVAIADFNGDLHPDLYLCRAEEHSDIYQDVERNVVMGVFFVSKENKEEGFNFATAGKINFQFLGQSNQWLDVNEIFIGATGFHPAAASFSVTADDPELIGIKPHHPGIDRGAYVGIDPDSGYWNVVISNNTPTYYKYRIKVSSSSSISQVAPIGFDPKDKRYPEDILLVRTANGFKDVTRDSGLPVNNAKLCDAVVAGDFDNDGVIDIFAASIDPVTYLSSSFFLNNNGNGTFLMKNFTTVSNLGQAKSATTADYNLDGFLDLLIVNKWNHLFQNTTNTNNWLEIDLEGSQSNRDGIGAKIVLTAGGRVQMREQAGGIHRFSQDHTRIHFGLGQTRTVTRVTVFWPSGQVQRITNVPANQILHVKEPTG